MRLYVNHRIDTNNRIYLPYNAHSRNQLISIIGSPYFQIAGFHYSVNDVFAEPSTGNTIAAAVIGGLLGGLTGGVGLLLGGLGGAMVGNVKESNEIQKINTFNSIRIPNI